MAKTSLNYYDPPLNYLPGPVNLVTGVLESFSAPPISHRGTVLINYFTALRQRFCRLVHAERVQILPGTESLANAMVAAQLTRLPGSSLVLVGGEFGERL